MNLTPTYEVGVRNIITLAGGLRFPEGPAFAPDGSLWFVELHGQTLIRLKDDKLKKYVVGGKPNGIAIDSSGKIWFCDAGLNAVRCFDPETEVSKTVTDSIAGTELANPNDLAFDKLGNLVFTCPGNSRQVPSGYVCVLTITGVVKKIATGLYYPNGLAFTENYSQLIIAETYKHRLWRGAWDDQSCAWSHQVVFAETGNTPGPDGMAFDKSGNLHVAVYGSGKVKVYNDTGSLADEIELTGKNPTNCAFDPSGHLGLVITEAEKGLLLSCKYNLLIKN